MNFTQDPIWPEVRWIRNLHPDNRDDLKIDIEGGSRTVMGWLRDMGSYCIAEFMISYEAPKYQQEQDGLLMCSLTETQTGTYREGLATWLAEKMDREVERMKAAYWVHLAILEEEAKS